MDPLVSFARSLLRDVWAEVFPRPYPWPFLQMAGVKDVIGYMPETLVSVRTSQITTATYRISRSESAVEAIVRSAALDLAYHLRHVAAYDMDDCCWLIAEPAQIQLDPRGPGVFAYGWVDIWHMTNDPDVVAKGRAMSYIAVDETPQDPIRGLSTINLSD